MSEVQREGTHYRCGNLRADKIQYDDGVGCCIWEPLDSNPDSGVCWDFSYDEVDDVIALLQHLKTVEPEVYEDE